MPRGRHPSPVPATVGRWTVLRRCGVDGIGNVLYLCRCRCGRERAIRGSKLRAADTLECRECYLQAVAPDRDPTEAEIRAVCEALRAGRRNLA
jgi:hypothetical protein